MPKASIVSDDFQILKDRRTVTGNIVYFLAEFGNEAAGIPGSDSWAFNTTRNLWNVKRELFFQLANKGVSNEANRCLQILSWVTLFIKVTAQNKFSVCNFPPQSSVVRIRTSLSDGHFLFFDFCDVSPPLSVKEVGEFLRAVYTNRSLGEIEESSQDTKLARMLPGQVTQDCADFYMGEIV